MLPNPLRIPYNDPTVSAEYAPVPGRQDAAQNANFGETDLATSGGVGAGGDGEGILPGMPLVAVKPPPVFTPKQKQCIGDPPRQTEDPLSPPCVPFFDGDNGGATWQGVTRDEIHIIYYNDFNVRGDMNAPYRPTDETGNQADYYYYNHTRTVKALLRYFEKRYQTYGRRVRVTAYPSGSSGLATSGQSRLAHAEVIASDMEPFAVAILIENAQEFSPRLARYGINSFGWNEDVPVRYYNESAPYFWSFMPDQETESKWSASFICRKLKDRTAKFTDDLTLRGQPRTFGLLYLKDSASQRGPFLSQLATLLQKELGEQCGMEFDDVKPFGGSGDAGPMMTSFKNQGITTVLCYCIPQINELHVPAFQNAATAINYFPEWYWDHASAMDRALWQQQYGSPRHKGFGVSYLWRQPAFRESYAYQAYLSEEPGSVPNLRFNHEIYHVFLNMFSGIQAAGPYLTPETIKRGMFTFRYSDPDFPWVPTGGYGDAGPSPYTFVDTAQAWWYDPTGTPPGGRQAEGCIRVVYGGARYYGHGAGRQWPPGDEDIFLDKWPCTEDVRRMVEGR